jgi:pimeloyl-ACP methyl ester carboxylesterase
MRIAALMATLIAASGAVQSASAQPSPGTSGLRRTFVSLTDAANAVIVEPPQSDPVRGRIAILVVHPEHLNLFDYFLGPEFARRGYRTMLMNYYGREETYDEFLAPIAAAVRYLRRQPGIEKVVLAGHSSGGAELSFYQDVAENGPAACRGAERTVPCKTEPASDLPRADALMLLEANIGAPLRTMSIDPAVDNVHPRVRNPALDMFDPRNGFDAKSGAGHYSADFEYRFLAAQRARNVRLIEQASARLEKIDEGQGQFADDEPFVVAGGSVRINGARLDLADRRLLSRTREPRLLLKGDGTTNTQIVSTALGGTASAADLGRLYDTAQAGTVRHYLSFYGLKTTPEYTLTANDIRGILWRSSANSAPGNVEGVTVPTLVMAGTCTVHLVPLEITYEHSAAKDKQFVAVEGADHFFQPCKPQYRDTARSAFDFADAWLTNPGRL